MPELKRRRPKKQPGIKYASVQFKGQHRQYTFKTILDLTPGDKVVVRTAQGLGTGEVYNSHCEKPSNMDVVDYKWILGKINLPTYERNWEKDLKDLGINESDV